MSRCSPGGNEALEDIAALVAHELKSSLYAAVRGTDPSSGVEDALALVDSILEIARTESACRASAPVARCLGEALHDLGRIEAEVVVLFRLANGLIGPS